MTFFYFISLFISTVLSNVLNQNDIDKLTQDVRARVDSFTRPDMEDDEKPLIPTLVRLSFHDCVGKVSNVKPYGRCNGCLNINDNSHSGIEFGAIYPIEQVYQNKNKVTIYGSSKEYSGETYNKPKKWSNPSGVNWSTKFSRADMWALAATIAIEYSIELAWIEFLDPNAQLTPARKKLQVVPSWDIVATVKYQIGRTDCATSPVDSTPIDMNPNWEYDRLKQFFTDHLGFSNDRDIISLMGLHRLGRGHKRLPRNNMVNDYVNNCCSGGDYYGKWNNRASHILTNEYYAEQYYSTMKQLPVNQFWNGSIIPASKATSTQLQWKHDPTHDPLTMPHESFYLNIDRAIQFPRDLTQKTLFDTYWTGLEIINDTVGESNCTMWAIGCAVDDEDKCIDPDLIDNKCVGEVSELFNTQLWFEIYHVFGLPFYRDVGLSFFKMIQLNENNLQTVSQKDIPNWRFVGTKSTKNINRFTRKEYIDEREPPTGIYMDLYVLQQWELKPDCSDIIKITGHDQKNKKSITLNSYNGYIFIYITRSIKRFSEKYHIYQWFGKKIDTNTKHIIMRYTETIKAFIERSTDIVTEWSEFREITITTVEEKKEKSFKKYFEGYNVIADKTSQIKCTPQSFINPFAN